MVFWAGIIIAVLLATISARRGLYDTWSFAFNSMISIYVAIFAEPYVSAIAPSANETPFGNLLVVAGLAFGAFVVLQSISLLIFAGHFTVPFPKILDISVAGLLGFLTGFLLWNFGAFVVCNMPLFPETLAKKIHYDSDARQLNVTVLSVPCGIVNMLVANENEYTTQKATDELLSKVEKHKQALAAPKIKTRTAADPNELSEQRKEIKEMLGPPPELEQQ